MSVIKKLKDLIIAQFSKEEQTELEKLGKKTDIKLAAQPVSYPVDGGVPVFVDISDDGIPDIDANDKVYTDAALTIPYPDGTYKVTGGNFGFTVAAGAVTVVTDPDGVGAGPPSGSPTDPPATPPAADTPAQMAAKAAALLANPVLAQMSIQMATEKTEIAKAHNALNAKLKEIEKENIELKKAIQLSAKAIDIILNTPIQNSAAEKVEKKKEDMSNYELVKFNRGEKIYV